MLRKFVSSVLFFSLIAMLITGTVLFIMPHGRVAYWTGWHFLGLDKDQWDNLHIIFGFIMVFFGIWHAALNWRSLVNYFKEKDFLFAGFFSLVVAVGAVLNVPPFKNFIEFGESIKQSWPKPKTMPPAPHAELFPLTKIAKMVGLTPQEALSILKQSGLKVSSPNLTLKEIARLNNTTPAHVYELLLKHGKKTPSPAAAGGFGMGRMTLKKVCSELGIPVSSCIERLKKAGIEASPEQRLRDIAFKHGYYPYQILQILKGGSNGQVKQAGH
ncbi:glycoside hydrolase family 18 [Thermovibrio ammonificans HB-1]|uniref:Glycoside hydrolase family 18 n=1 Tax=Thermovibrio ammonificans (strain DSM 15698 / JCM 12110 / HB-1) TaxID=648996 RepID=E8T206_THEA1|nr:DUF4405 domain-containing protein [Thermovibrio ammonificans]ADU96901.1 glycoside hydrolase family 18 [Thermovibrio ammonificans HB-1]